MHRPAKEPLLLPLFLKWAGGKLQLIEQFENLFPHNFRNYYEPFIGSGAVFFYVKSKLKPNKVILSDTNEELINCFCVVRDKPSELVELLLNHRKKHSKEYYYTVRSIEFSRLDNLARAARLIYLNKTCFNGLYRVNSKGQFNVPFGDYENPSIFTRYSKSNFSMKEQKRLSEVFGILDSRGCFVMLSNSDHALTRELYRHYEKNTVIVTAKRMINSVGSRRGGINEVVVTNYSVAKVETS